MVLKTLTRGKDSAIVEAGSQAEITMKKLGFVECNPPVKKTTNQRSKRTGKA